MSVFLRGVVCTCVFCDQCAFNCHSGSGNRSGSAYLATSVAAIVPWRWHLDVRSGVGIVVDFAVDMNPAYGCFNCGGLDHNEAACPVPWGCWDCRGPHLRRHCPNPPATREPQPWDCWACGGNHHRRQCPNDRYLPGWDCEICGGNHFTRYCPDFVVNTGTAVAHNTGTAVAQTSPPSSISRRLGRLVAAMCALCRRRSD